MKKNKLMLCGAFVVGLFSVYIFRNGYIENSSLEDSLPSEEARIGAHIQNSESLETVKSSLGKPPEINDQVVSELYAIQEKDLDFEETLDSIAKTLGHESGSEYLNYLLSEEFQSMVYDDIRDPNNIEKRALEKADFLSQSALSSEFIFSATETATEKYYQKWSAFVFGLGINQKRKDELQGILIDYESHNAELLNQWGNDDISFSDLEDSKLTYEYLKPRLSEFLNHEQLAELEKKISAPYRSGLDDTLSYEEYSREMGYTNLMRASVQGDATYLSSLLAAGAEVDSVDLKDGATALIKASSAGQSENVAALIAAGANLDATDLYGSSALIKAIKSGSVETVKVLVEAGANVNAEDVFGFTPLLTALDYKYVDDEYIQIAQLLSEYGAEL